MFIAISEPSRADLGPISVSVQREVSPTTSPGTGPGLLTTAAVTAPTPPAETTNATSSPSSHHPPPHFQGSKYTHPPISQIIVSIKVFLVYIFDDLKM